MCFQVTTNSNETFEYNATEAFDAMLYVEAMADVSFQVCENNVLQSQKCKYYFTVRWPDFVECKSGHTVFWLVKSFGSIKRNYLNFMIHITRYFNTGPL